METVQSLMISLTDRAVEQVKVLRKKENIAEGKQLRLGVKGGGCSGLSYILEFDEKNDLDKIYQIKGIDVLVDPRHELYIAGMVVDYQSGLNDRGFIFENPNATSSCGCGTSFSTS
ncbi:MAG: iron-sulfur cluster assembly accessory protein [Bacteroidota bacterium]